MKGFSQRVGALLTAAATALSLTTLTAAASASAAPAAPAIAWEKCPEQVDAPGAQCGRISVPTYYDNPSVGSISVGFVKVPAANPGARRGALFTNPGGPGGDAYLYAGSSMFEWPQDLRSEWDIIGVQPRGLKGSTPVECLEGASGDIVQSWLNAGAYTRDSCEKATPGYTNSLTTYNTARDWDMVRWALGEERISIVGLSYGTFLGSTYATLFPQRTDRLVLDSAMSQDLAWNGILESQKAGYRMAYNDFFAYVARNDAKFHLGNTPLAVYQRWSQKVQQEAGVRPSIVPPNAQIGDLPAGLEIAGQTGADALTATGELRVNAEAAFDRALNPAGSQVSSPTFGLTRILVPMPRQWEDLALHIAGVKDMGSKVSGGELSPEQQEAMFREQYNNQSMQNLILCNENQASGNPAYIPELLWTHFVVADLAASVTDMYASGVSCRGRAPVMKPHPISGAHLATRPLQISGTRDPQTPYRYHGAMAKAMGAHVITVHGPGHGHVGMGNAAVDAAVVEYLRTGHTAVTDLPGIH